MSVFSCSKNNTPVKIAEVGKYLGMMFMDTMRNFISANGALMKGETYGNTGDIRNYVQNGQWVDFPGLNETTVLDQWNNLLTAAAMNQLFRMQKIFIVGGGPCDDSGNIGKGPQEAKLCRNGKAWYLYFWKEPRNSVTFGKAQWGHVSEVPGHDELGKGIYTSITPQVRHTPPRGHISWAVR